MCLPSDPEFAKTSHCLVIEAEYFSTSKRGWAEVVVGVTLELREIAMGEDHLMDDLQCVLFLLAWD